MMPMPMRFGEFGDWDFDSFGRQAPTSTIPFFQAEQTLQIGSDSLLSEDIWKKFEILDIPMNNSNVPCYNSTDEDSETDTLLSCASRTVKEAREIRHHDCMWAGRCGSKDHKKIVKETTNASTMLSSNPMNLLITRPTARKPMRIVKKEKTEIVVAVTPQTNSNLKPNLPLVRNNGLSVVNNNCVSLLKRELQTPKTNGRSLLRTQITKPVVTTTNVKELRVFKDALDSDGGSRPDTPQTSESEDDCEDLFKHNLDISSSVSVVCSDDTSSMSSYRDDYRTPSGSVEYDDQDDEFDDDDHFYDEEDDDECDNDDSDNELADPSTAVAVSEVTGQRRPVVATPVSTHLINNSFKSDHSYHQSKAVRLDNLGVQTPSDSEEEIDVVSFDGEQPSSRSSSVGGTSLPTNPSDSDRKQLQAAVKSAITKKKKDAVSEIASPNGKAGMKTPVIRAVAKKSILELRAEKLARFESIGLIESSYTKSLKVKNSKKRPAEEEGVRVKGVKRAKHAYHHRLTHHKLMSPKRKKKGGSTGSSSPRSGCGSSDSEPESIEKRSLHNNMERQRRIDLRNLVEGLRVMIPSVENKSRAPKVIILREASNYCQDLTERYEESLTELESLRLRQNKLRQRVSALRREAAKVR